MTAPFKQVITLVLPTAAEDEAAELTSRLAKFLHSEGYIVGIENAECRSHDDIGTRVLVVTPSDMGIDLGSYGRPVDP